MSTDKEIEIMCENITYLRKVNGFTLEEMAKKLGIGIKSLQKLERKELSSKLTVDILYNIQCNFGISPADIFKSVVK